MHFTYKYINHEIEKFQKYSDFIFLQVWCKARQPFNTVKFDRYPELQTIFNNLENDPGEWAQFFVKNVKDIYIEFLKLGKAEKKELSRCYQINNNVSRLCSNNTLSPISYTDLQKKYRKISGLLKTFYDRLYGSESPLILKEFGNLKDIRLSHYRAFIQKNFDGHEGMCPFCGLNPIKGNDHSKLEAYDHFIPKAQYPFNSINFKNLAPMCHECNSSYKLKINPVINLDPLSKNTIRRKAFYPYSRQEWEITIKLILNNTDIKNLKKEEISIHASCNGRLEEIDSWKEVFGIEERYKAKILGKHTGKKWYLDLVDGFDNAKKILRAPDLTKEEWLEYVINQCETDLMSDCGFLKKPFFQECDRRGIN